MADNSLATAQIADANADNTPKSKAQPGFSAFSALSMQDDGPPEVDENEDFGGLMVRSCITFEFPESQLPHHHVVRYKSVDNKGKEGEEEG